MKVIPCGTARYWWCPSGLARTESRKWRLVLDFRRLNEKTIGDVHPPTDIKEILDPLGQSKYFTFLDIVMGYYQIEVEGEGTKTTFATKQGHWE